MLLKFLAFNILLVFAQDYKHEMRRLAREKEALITRARQLLTSSGAVQSVDIQRRLTRLEEAWRQAEDVTSQR